MRSSALFLVLMSCDDALFPVKVEPVEGEGWCGVRGVFASQCVGCHSSAGAIGGLDLESDPHAAVVNVPSAGFPGTTLIVPSDADGSLLFRKVGGTQSGDEGGTMPPGTTLEPDVLTVFRDWIAAGADDVCEGTVPTGQGYHPEGWALPAVHGLATKLQTEVDCRTCHGDLLDGGTSGIACSDCHPSDWQTTCTFCHGGVETPDGAPPEDIDDGTDPAGLSFRAHTTHVTETIHTAWDCATCHTTPTEALTPGHLFDDDTPGVAEVTFGGGLSPNGSYLGNGACSNLYCHGTGLTNGSYDHDQPPPTCHTCHPDWTSTELTLDTMSGQHRDHVKEDQVDCSECHAAVVDASDTIVAPALHVDGAVSLQFPVGFTYDASGCTGSCHGQPHASEGW